MENQEIDFRLRDLEESVGNLRRAISLPPISQILEGLSEGDLKDAVAWLRKYDGAPEFYVGDFQGELVVQAFNIDGVVISQQGLLPLMLGEDDYDPFNFSASREERAGIASKYEELAGVATKIALALRSAG